ncbi:MAG: hypothetical protein ACOC5J_00010 [Gemmatimonadota bacterium]
MNTQTVDRRRTFDSPGLETGGFALPVAIFALVVVGVMVTGGFFLAQQESRIGVASQNATQAVYVAEEGMNEVVANWGAHDFTTLANWDSDVVSGTTDNGTWTTEVLRTSPQTYWVRTSGTVTEGGAMYAGATRDVGMFYRVIVPNIIPPAALSTVGNLTVAGSSQIQGNDSEPTGWGGSCTTGTDDKPGILIDDQNNVDTSGNAYSIDGDPPVDEDPDMDSEELLTFGDLTFDDLAAMATSTYTYPGSPTLTGMQPDSVETSPGSGTYRCDSSDSNNWGDPINSGSVCFSHFPILYAPSDLNINSSASGQGILLVEGDLRIQGGFEFYGIVIVRETFVTAGTGGHVNGGVIAANAELDTNTVTGNAVVTNSTCASTRAVMNNATFTQPKPLSQRSWVDMTALTY